MHRRGEANSALWSLPGWFRVAHVSDDGHLITGYDGINLVPTESPEKSEILTFWYQGQRLRTYTLADLGYDRSQLQQTVSHYHWGSYDGFDTQGHFSLSMVDGRVLVFDVTNGALVEGRAP